jgi:2-methylcitrate dehydratase PrpD
VIQDRSSTACEHLAERVLGVAGSLAPERAEIGSRRVFDTLGALALGTSLSTGHETVDQGLPATVAALCAATRYTEVDDIERRSCITPGSVAVPVALAIAAERRPSGPTVLAAVVAGYEAMVAIGEAIDGARILYRGIWPSYLAAPVAAAATAARVLELDHATFVDALSIAAARSAGIVGQPEREPTSRWFLYGRAAAEGVAAALAAERGVAGDPAVLEAVLGSHTLGEVGAISFPVDVPAIERVDVKPFCTARQAQSAIEAARGAWTELAAGQPDTEAIAAIEVGVPEAYRRMVDQPDPVERLTSIMSAQYQIALALTDPKRLYDVARAEPRLSAAGAAVMDTVTVVADPELTPLFPDIWPARVSIALRDGGEASKRVLSPDGAEGPIPDWDWLASKHGALGSFGDETASVAERCRALQADTPASVRPLLDQALIHRP